MATTQPRYSHSKIYKLINYYDDKTFIGSTTSTLTKKLSEHKKTAVIKQRSVLNRFYNKTGWHRVDIVLIHEFSCENIEQMNRENQRWIDLINPILNKSDMYLFCPHGNLYTECKYLCVGKKEDESCDEFRSRHCMKVCEILDAERLADLSDNENTDTDDDYEASSDEESELEFKCKMCSKLFNSQASRQSHYLSGAHNIKV
jgi:hypothetical protein